ncbi:MAG: S49 family peptidase, partial [Halobacteriota archaeon]
MDKLGLSYEQFTAGEYKDAGVPLREIEANEREYLQSVVDGYYDRFVETVSKGRDMDPEAVRDRRPVSMSTATLLNSGSSTNWVPRPMSKPES